jgi:hypothetical protein
MLPIPALAATFWDALVPSQPVVLRAYPNNPAARYAMRAKAK